MVTQAEQTRENQEKTVLFKAMIEALKRMVLESLRQKLTETTYSENGVLGQKLTIAREVFHEAQGKADEGEKKSLLQKSAWILVELKREKEEFEVSRERSSQSELVRGVNKSIDEAIDKSQVRWTNEQRRRLNESRTQTKNQVQTLDNEALSRHPQERVLRQQFSNLSREDLQRNQEEAFRQAKAASETKLGGREPDHMSDAQFDEQLQAQTEELQKYLENEGIELEMFAVTPEQKAVVQSINQRIAALDALGPDDYISASVYQELNRYFVENAHLLPPGELAQIRATLQVRERHYARAIAEASVRSESPRYNLTIEEAEAKNKDIANRLRARQITPREAMAEIARIDVGDEVAYRRALMSPQYWRRKSDIGGEIPIGLTGYDPEGGELSPDMMNYRDPDFVFRQLMSEVDEKYFGVDHDRVLYKRMVDDYVLQIIQSEGSRRGDYNIMQLTAKLDMLLRSQKSIEAFGLTTKERNDTRDQVGAVMAIYDFGQSGSTINMEQWAGIWKTISTESFADMLGFSTLLNVEFERADGTKTTQDVELQIGDMVDILHHHDLVKLVMSRDFNVRDEGINLIAMYAIASQLDGWVDVKTPGGTTDFSKLNYEPIEGGYMVWMGDRGNAVKLVGMRNPITGNEFKGAEDLKNISTAMAKYVVSLEKHVTLGLSRYNHKYDGDFNDQLYKHVGNAYARAFGIVEYHEIFEAMDSMKRDPMTETYYKQNKLALKTLEQANEAILGRAKSEMLRKAGATHKENELVRFEEMLEFLTTNNEGYHMTKEQMLTSFKALMIDRETTNSYGKKVSRLDRVPFNKRAQMEVLLESVIDNDNFDWQTIIFHHLGKGTNGDNYRERAREKLHLRSVDELPDWITFKGVNGFKTFLLLESSSRVYSNKSAEVQLMGNAQWMQALRREESLSLGAYAWDMAKQADYLFKETKAKPTRFAFSNNFDPQEYIKFMLTKGEEGYSWMNREQLEWMITRTLLAKDKVYKRQKSVDRYVRDRNNTMTFVGVNEEGAPVFESETKSFYYLGHERGAKTEQPWFSKWYIDELYSQHLIQNKDVKEYLMGKSVETVMGVPLNRLTVNPFGWMPKVPFIGKHLEGFMPVGVRWGPGPMINWLRKEFKLLDKPKYVQDVFGEWFKLVGEAAGQGLG